MNRRGFLGALLGSLALDPERALWIPGRKLISIPRPAEDWQGLYNAYTSNIAEAIRLSPKCPWVGPLPHIAFHRDCFALAMEPVPAEVVAQALGDMNAMLDRWNREPLRPPPFAPQSTQLPLRRNV